MLGMAGLHRDLRSRGSSASTPWMTAVGRFTLAGKMSVFMEGMGAGLSDGISAMARATSSRTVRTAAWHTACPAVSGP